MSRPTWEKIDGRTHRLVTAIGTAEIRWESGTWIPYVRGEKKERLGNRLVRSAKVVAAMLLCAQPITEPTR